MVTELNNLTRECAREVIDEREKTNGAMLDAYENLKQRLIDQAQIIREKGEQVAS